MTQTPPPAYRQHPPARRRPIRALAGLAATALAVSAYANHRAALQAERDNPPRGRFLDLHGVRLHYLERGDGPVLVLLHGNGSMIEDFVGSGLVALAARTHRVIVFDRPGFGHSTRPRGRVWSAAAQADLLHAALRHLGVARATVLGHSWGCAVAVALARRDPGMVGALVLAAGYHYPTARPEVIGLSAPGVPVLGDALRYTISPPLARLIWPRLVRRIFAPAPVAPGFAAFPREMALRPSQLRASGAETAMMIPQAAAARHGYRELHMPVEIIAGADDRVVDSEAQSARLHREIEQSGYTVLPGVGHMAHQTAPEAVMAAIERAEGRAGAARPA
jgi:pimeloyl-ACP methyl ester carboxylesterase